MEKLKRVLHKLLFPHIALVAALVPISAGLLIYAFAADDANEYVTYVSYALSAYTLSLVCVRAPRWAKDIGRIKTENSYVSRYVSDAHLRVKISLYSSLIVNIAYVAMQLGLGVYHNSIWYYSLAVYYFLLAAMRWPLLKETLKHEPGENAFWEYLHYRFCGILLLVMNLALAVIVAYIVWQGRGFAHHFITTIAMAAYTFGTLAKAIVNVIKYRRYESPVFSASKAISLAAASVSVLTLETAMLSAFGQENSENFRRLMTAATGCAVCLFVLALAVYMIVHSTKEINRIKRSLKDE